MGRADKVFDRLKPLDGLNLLERYAILMVQIQWVELILKRLLTDERGYDFDELENYTAFGNRFLGLLKKEGMHDKLLTFLDELKNHRNYFAHEFMANQMIVNSILKDEALGYTKPYRELRNALFAFEQFILMHEELPRHAFFKKKRSVTNPKGRRRSPLSPKSLDHHKGERNFG